MSPLRVKISLQNIECFDEGDGSGNAEPYLWTVFFKIDGDTVKVNNDMHLQGKATVIGSTGSHENLDADYDDGVDAGQAVGIPAAVGTFQTILKPIPISFMSGKTVGGVAGFIALLMEEDFTPDDIAEKGHQALNQTVQEELNNLIPTFSLGHRVPTPVELKQLEDKIKSSIKSAMENETNLFEVSFRWTLHAHPLPGIEIINPDDFVGSCRGFFTHSQLEEAPENGIPLRYEWANEGHWALNGLVSVSRLLSAGIFRSGNWANRLYVGLDTDSFIKRTQKLLDEDGLRLVKMATYTDNGIRRWAGISRSGDWAFRFVIGLNLNDFKSEIQKFFDNEGMRLTNITTYLDGGKRWWAGISRSGDWANKFIHDLSLKDFRSITQKLFDEEDLRLEDMVTYVDNGQRKWAGVYRTGNWAHRFISDLDYNKFKLEAQKLFDEDGLRLTNITTYVDNGQRKWASISTSGDWGFRFKMKWDLKPFLNLSQELFDTKGYRIEDLEICEI